MTAALLWLAVALPAAGALAARLAPRGAGALAAAAAAAAAVPPALLLAAAEGGREERSALAWLPAARLDAGLRLDPLAAAMSVLVAAVGLAVVVYSAGYFAGSPRARSALAGLLLFLAAMQGLVLADGYLTLLVFWELVGALSARLIAWSRDDPAAAPGAVRAFLTTRTADLGFYLAILALYAGGGTLAFETERPAGWLGALVGGGLVLAAMGKSAQVPLQTWLAAAMAGPTPVSALLHSATMVAAGVYLLVRSQSLLAGWPLELAGWVGAVTAVLGAGIALAQRDLKRVLAGSTTSQLGLMFLGAAAGGPAVALFHLVAQAAAKAAMFLAAGIFHHERGSTDLEALAGAGRDDRAAFACFAAGAASLAAVPPLAAFWSKEAILAAAEDDPAWLALGLLAGAGSAAYLLRPALVLWRRAGARGPARGPGRRAMLAGAVPLAAASLVAGALGAPLGELLGAPVPRPAALGAALSLAALGAGLAAVLAGVRPPRRLRRLAAEQLFVNEALRTLATGPALALARASDLLDRRGVDAAVDGAARGGLALAAANDRVERGAVDAAVDRLAHAVGRGGDRLRLLQSGRLYEYLRATVAGAGAVAAVVALAALT